MRIQRGLTVICLSLLALMLVVTPAGAGVTWCRADPIVELNGTEVQIWVSMDGVYEDLVTGPIRVTVFAPNKVSKEITFLDQGFNEHGEEVIFKNRKKVNDDGTFPFEIKVKVPVNTKLLSRDFGINEIPIQIEVLTGDGQVIHVDGSNHGTHVSLELHGTP